MSTAAVLEALVGIAGPHAAVVMEVYGATHRLEGAVLLVSPRPARGRAARRRALR